MNRWDVFVLFLCVVERRCLRRFFNLLQASLHLSKQLLASIVAVVISYLTFPPWNSQNIKLYVSICHITLLFFLLREELTGFVWHRHIWNTINTTYCYNAEPFAHARQCFGRFLSLTALALAVVASSLGSIILVLGAAAVLWWWDMAGKLSDTAHCLCPPARHRLIPLSPDGVRFPSMPQPLEKHGSTRRGGEIQRWHQQQLAQDAIETSIIFLLAFQINHIGG